MIKIKTIKVINMKITLGLKMIENNEQLRNTWKKAFSSPVLRVYVLVSFMYLVGFLRRKYGV